MATRTPNHERDPSMTEDDKTTPQSSAEDLASLVPKRRSNSPLALILLGVIGVVGAGAWFYTVGGQAESTVDESPSNATSQSAQSIEDNVQVNAAAPPPPPPPPPPVA